MRNIAGYILLALIVFSGLKGLSQNNPTLNKNEKEKSSYTTHKVLLVPFDPKLYMSEVDRNIHAETKLTAKEIKFKFRDGLNEQISKALKAGKFGVLDLMDDTVKYKKDLHQIYQYLAYDYLKVPDQNKYKVPSREKDQKKIEKGQLSVETNSETRFMDARITDPKILQQLHAKYRTDLFLYINQLDIRAAGSKDPLDLGLGNENRLIVVHYTIFNLNGKEINSGIIEEEFDPLINVPKKIVDRHFSKIAITMQLRLQKAVSSSN